MQPYERMLHANHLWARKQNLRDPTYFGRQSYTQNPEVLWIGCSDSRVSAEIIVSAQPGDMFVHRNIANQVITTDFNSLSVLQYAVEELHVKHVIVCGHYHCGGIQAAFQKQSPHLLIVNKWLKHVKDVYRLHQDEIEALPTKRERLQRLVELNVIEQVQNLAHTSIVQNAWRKHKKPSLHGWVYGLRSGKIRELTQMSADTIVSPIYEYSESDLALP